MKIRFKKPIQCSPDGGKTYRKFDGGQVVDFENEDLAIFLVGSGRAELEGLERGGVIKNPTFFFEPDDKEVVIPLEDIPGADDAGDG